MTTPVNIQYVGQRRVDRSYHLWQRRVDNTYQCLLCGGVGWDTNHQRGMRQVREANRRPAQIGRKRRRLSCPEEANLRPSTDSTTAGRL